MVSNPPYIGTAEQGTVDASVRDYEPHIALFSGEQGMEVINRMADQAIDRLIPGGRLIFEISPIIAAQCQSRIEQVSTKSLYWYSPHCVHGSCE